MRYLASTSTAMRLLKCDLDARSDTTRTAHSEASQPCFHTGIFLSGRLNTVCAAFVLGVQEQGCASGAGLWTLRVTAFVDFGNFRRAQGS